MQKKSSLHPVRSYQFPSNESHDDEGDNNKESVAAQQGEGNREEEKVHWKFRKSKERIFFWLNSVLDDGYSWMLFSRAQMITSRDDVISSMTPWFLPGLRTCAFESRGGGYYQNRGSWLGGLADRRLCCSRSVGLCDGWAESGMKSKLKVTSCFIF